MAAHPAAQETLGGSDQLLHQVLDTLPVGVVVIDRAGDVVLTNGVASSIWAGMIESGAERWARSKGFWHETGAQVAPSEWASVRALNAGTTSLNELIDIETFDGQHKTIENSAAPVRNEEGLIVGAVIVNQDVTQRVSAQDALRRTERILRDAEELGHIGSWEHDLVTGEFFNTEENLRLFFGDVSGKGSRFEDYVEAVHPEDREYVQARHDQLVAEGGPREIEYRVVWPDGQIHVIRGLATVTRNESGQAVRIYGTNIDVTHRVHTEQVLRESTERQQHLSRRLLAAHEEERRHLSRELHDEFGQLLATVTVQLQAAKALAGEAARSRLEECIRLMQRAGAEVRGMALELRPVMLETAGLDATLRWLADQHQQQTGTPTEVTGHLGAVAGDPAIVCFRIVQEALTNVLRHAKARHVRIELQQSEGALELAVCDDGIGFDVTRTQEQSAQRGQLGLLGMRERVQILGGTLLVSSTPGRGSCISMALPLADPVTTPLSVGV